MSDCQIVTVIQSAKLFNLIYSMISDYKFKHLMPLNCYNTLVRSYIILTIQSECFYELAGSLKSGIILVLHQNNLHTDATFVRSRALKYEPEYSRERTLMICLLVYYRKILYIVIVTET